MASKFEEEDFDMESSESEDSDAEVSTIGDI